MIILQEKLRIQSIVYLGNRIILGPNLSGNQVLFRIFLLLLLILAPAMVLYPVSADLVSDPGVHNHTLPQVVQVGIYVININNFNVGDGSFETNFYLTLKSETPVSLGDIDLVNGQTTSVDPILDTPNDKSYRIFANMNTNPDLHQYPFDQHHLPIEIEPKKYDESRMILTIHKNSTGHEPESGIPGWYLVAEESYNLSKSYGAGETPYSRAVFRYDIRRETTSVILKFFLPILIIIILSLSSLLIRGPSRVTMNASLIIVAVFIHWRISDAIPLVAYATFLDVFMIITYITMALDLLSGVFIQRFTESDNPVCAEKVNFWGIRVIPLFSIILYLLLFGTLIL